tara:strand:- start:19 stop:213 length:195 start_codon:yes stop_codon:yes gene_type:complete
MTTSIDIPARSKCVEDSISTEDKNIYILNRKMKIWEIFPNLSCNGAKDSFTQIKISLKKNSIKI